MPPKTILNIHIMHITSYIIKKGLSGRRLCTYIINGFVLWVIAKITGMTGEPAVHKRHFLLAIYIWTDIETLFFLFLKRWWVITISLFMRNSCLNLRNELCADKRLTLPGTTGLYWQMLNFVCKQSEETENNMYHSVDTIKWKKKVWLRCHLLVW